MVTLQIVLCISFHCLGYYCFAFWRWYFHDANLAVTHGLDRKLRAKYTPTCERCNPFLVCMQRRQSNSLPYTRSFTFMLQIELHPLLQAWHRSC